MWREHIYIYTMHWIVLTGARTLWSVAKFAVAADGQENGHDIHE